MVIYKFGGASVKNESAFQMLRNIVSACSDELVIVVSAMGKTTNKLEWIVKAAASGLDNVDRNIILLENYHLEIAEKLMPAKAYAVREEIKALFLEIIQQVEKYKGLDFNFFYDQVVSMGEIISTRIVSRYLEYEGISNELIDIRELLKTDENYRDASIDFVASSRRLEQAVTFDRVSRYVTQGFIGSAENGNTTTLGREGSDLTAAILGNIMNAESVTLWKDVDGIFNADPALFENVSMLDKISYQEMIELAYYGAKVIHPKTIKPLFSKNIPLQIKSFYNPDNKGTAVGDFSKLPVNIPNIIIKKDQVLLSISLDDLSFISESQISKFFSLLYKFRLKANLMQHSAISFTVCVDEPRGKEIEDVIEILRKEFKVLYNEKLTLITIRNYTEESINEHLNEKKVYVEQRSRNTVQYLVN